MNSSLPFRPDSRTWLINRERLVLLAGPGAAVLQIAHPQVALGVAKHSQFRSDPTGRLRRTLDAVYAIAFGSKAEIAIVRSRVAAAHQAVRGDGYSAFDPDAQLWVLATLIMGSVTMFQRFVRPLERHELDAFLVENVAFGEVFGLYGDQLPREWPAFETYWKSMLKNPLLGSDPACAMIANAVVRPISPILMRMLSPVFRALAMEFIPADLQERLQLKASPLQSPLWKTLDLVVPTILASAPERIRFAPAYLNACRDLS